MKIYIQSQGFELTQGLRSHIERRIHFSLSWAAENIRTVTVRLSDQNATRGGIDKRCRFLVSLNGAADVVISETQADMYAAIDRAAERTGRTISRILSRMRNYQNDYLMPSYASVDSGEKTSSTGN